MFCDTYTRYWQAKKIQVSVSVIKVTVHVTVQDGCAGLFNILHFLPPESSFTPTSLIYD